MALNLKDMPTTGGGWFKPEAVKDAKAFLIEVNGFEPQRPTNHGPKDSALCDVTTFADDASLASGVPTSVVKGQRIEQTYLARDLKDMVGSATIVVLAQTKPKPGQKPAWVWRAVTDGGVKNAVIAYAEAREAASETSADIKAARDKQKQQDRAEKRNP